MYDSLSLSFLLHVNQQSIKEVAKRIFNKPHYKTPD